MFDPKIPKMTMIFNKTDMWSPRRVHNSSDISRDVPKVPVVVIMTNVAECDWIRVTV